jgi:hypothetical protein
MKPLLHGNLNKEELDKYHDEYFMPQTVEKSIEVIDIMCELMLKFIDNQKKVQSITEDDRYARILMQMVFLKTINSKKLLQGVNFDQSKSVKLQEVLDPLSISLFVRSIYETITSFSLIYNKCNSEEREIVFRLWKLAGLNYRKRFEENISLEEHKIKINNEKQEIKTLINEIKASSLFLHLNEHNQQKIITCIKDKKYLIVFDNNEVVFHSWGTISTVVGMNPDNLKNMYTYFSLNTHPSFISAAQFKEMFDDDEFYKSNSVLYANFIQLFLSMFIADYLTYFPDQFEEFKRLKIHDQYLINSYNVMLRNQSYSII